MSLGIKHTILYPQEKHYNYRFPANDGLIASENFVKEEVARGFESYEPTKEAIENGLGYNTRCYKLANTLVSTDATWKDVTNLSFTCTVGKTYTIQLIGAYQSNVVTMGCRLGVRLSSGAGTIIGWIEVGMSNLMVATEIKTPITRVDNTNTAGSFITTTGVNVINTPHNVGANISFTCTTSGVFTFCFSNETTGTADVSLMAGTSIIVNEF